jgi:glycosyltransferase involved in cell wall biosynthesis
MKHAASTSNPDRVAIICGAGIVSGKEIMALELGQGLREKGIDVHYVTSCWGSGEFMRRTQQLGFSTERMRLGFISLTPRPAPMKMTAHQAIFWPSLLRSYSKFMREFNPTCVIHTNWHHCFLLLRLLDRKRDIYWAHEIMANRALHRQVFQLIAKKVRSFVAVSQATSQALVCMGVDHERIQTIYNGVSEPRIDRTEKGIHGQRVGIVGQIGRWKGHEILLKAFLRIRNEFPDTQLHIFGRGTPQYEQLLRAFVAEQGMGSQVIFRGFLSNAGEIYRDMDICVIPSLSEDPLPTSAIEASRTGVPVVASDRGGLPEIVQDGETGLIFESGRDDLLAECLATLLRDPKLRQEMGARARRFAAEQFDVEQFVRKFEQVIHC